MPQENLVVITGICQNSEEHHKTYLNSTMIDLNNNKKKPLLK
mgnify:CR=1 FL=1